MLACVGGYACAEIANHLTVSGLFWLAQRRLFGDHFQIGLLVFWITLLFSFLGLVLASVFQWVLLRNYLENPFRWVKFTLIGAGCGAAINLTLFFSAPPVLCWGIDCGTGLDFRSEDFNPHRHIIWAVLGIVGALPLTISRGLAWRPLPLPLIWWCLALTGSQLLHSILRFLLLVYYFILDASNWTEVVLSGLLFGPVSAAITGLVVGLVTALFILPLLRRQIKLNHESPFAD